MHVPQIMQARRRDAGSANQLRHDVAWRVGVNWLADLIGEDVVSLHPKRAHPEPFGELSRPMLPQNGHGACIQRNDATLAPLGRSLDPPPCDHSGGTR